MTPTEFRLPSLQR